MGSQTMKLGSGENDGWQTDRGVKRRKVPKRGPWRPKEETPLTGVNSGRLLKTIHGFSHWPPLGIRKLMKKNMPSWHSILAQ
jgi:hypothetical protein